MTRTTYSLLGMMLAAATACGEIASDPDTGVTPDAGDSFDGGTNPDAMVEETDVDPPETTIDSTPDDPSQSIEATFTFSASEPDSIFFCRLGTATFTNCVSPLTVDLPGEGPHDFEVYAVDAADNADPTPASFSWIVDATPPVVTISSGPSNPTDLSTATLVFSADEEASFACALNGGTAAPCTSPANYTGLGEQAHSFTVTATDVAGNSGNAVYQWVRDASAPSIVITAGPPNPTNSRNATFTFDAEAGTTVQCRKDSDPFGPCTTGTTMAYANLTANQSHTFYVRATDGANNSAVASRTWNIDTLPPTVSILNRPSNPTNQTSAAFTFSVDEVATVRCRLNTGAYGSCDTPTSKSYASVPANATNTFYVEATDAAGNVGTGSYAWVVDTLPPDTNVTEAPSGTWPVDYFTVRFSSPEAGVSFECSLNSAPFAPCTSPRTYGKSGYIGHDFQVRAVDALSNKDASPAAASWTSTRGLVLHYTFDDTLRNSSALGKDHDGDGGGFGFVQGRFGEAIAFTDGLVKLRNTIAPLSNDEAYTLAMWVREPKLPVDNEVRKLFDFFDPKGGIIAYRESSFDYELRISYGTKEAMVEKGYATLITEGWRHVILEYRDAGADVSVWLDANFVASIKNTTGSHVFTGAQLPDLLVGENSQFMIDDLQVYNRTFTQKDKCEVIMRGLWVTPAGAAPYCK